MKRINLELDNPQDSVAQLIEVRNNIQQKDKFTCPHCNGEEIVGHGNYKGRKRYKCKACQKTFNDLTGTSVSCIHKKEEWNSYIQCIANNLTLREAAKQAGIPFRTSFMWRHKIIGAFEDMGCTKLEGIIEGDEPFFCSPKKGVKQLKAENPVNGEGKLQTPASMMSMLL